MESVVINTRADLDALQDTPEHARFMNSLRGTLWRLEKDDVAKSWVAIEDNSGIARFGFARSDFPGVAAPALPVYVPPPSDVPQTVTMRQARLALLAAGKLAAVAAAIAALTSPEKEAAQIEWEYSQTVDRNRPFVLLLGAALGLSDVQLDALFVQAAAL